MQQARSAGGALESLTYPVTVEMNRLRGCAFRAVELRFEEATNAESVPR